MLNSYVAAVPPRAFRCFGSRSQPGVIFPLTPVLSLGERENRIQSHDVVERSGFARARATGLPLLWGEDRGEGEQAVLQPLVPDDCLPGRTVEV